MRQGFSALVLVAVWAASVAVHGPPGDRQDPQLAMVLDVVRRAERVEALPVSVEGEGLSAIYRVVDRPVPLDTATGRALARLLIDHDWAQGSAMACAFQPSVAFRFRRGIESVSVRVCFLCGEMALDGIGGPLGGKQSLEPGARRTLLRAAKTAFPKQFDAFDAVVPAAKSKGDEP
jgi:hypothetical protein